MEQAIAKISVQKLDAARRQLRVAIRLWFAEGDPVAIHTLVSAAHEIIHTLFRRKGLKGLLFDSPILRDEYRGRFSKLLTSAYVFFKHARSDPNGTIEFNPEINEVLLAACATALKAMGEEPTIEDIAITYWFIIHNPDSATSTDKHKLPDQLFELFATLEKREFLDAFDGLHRDGKIIPMAG
jgi:hypothetical protein